MISSFRSCSFPVNTLGTNPKTCAVALLALVLLFSLLTGCSLDSDQRNNAFTTLARWEDQRLAPEDSLLAMIKAEDAHIRLQALRSAGLIGQHNIIPAMIEALNDPSHTVASQAAYSLGLLGDGAATNALEGILENPGSSLHLAAAKGLAHLPSQGRGLLIAATSDDPRIAAAAWDALRNIADQVDSTQLTAAIIVGLNHPASDVLWRVLRCAERLPSPELVPHLAAHVRSNQIQVKVHVYRALSKQDSAAALKAVLIGLQNENLTGQRQYQRTRIAACRAMGSLAMNAFIPENSFSNEERNVITEELIAAAGHPNTHLASTALEAMEKITTTFELPPEAAQQESLLPVWRIRLSRSAHSHLTNKSTPVRVAAIRSWAALRGSGSEQELHQLLISSTVCSDTEAILFCLARQGRSPLNLLADYSAGNRPVSIRVAALDGLHHLGKRIDAADDRDLILDILTRAAADQDFIVAATAIGFLADYNTRLSLVAMSEAWDTQYDEGGAEVRRAILRTLDSLGTDVIQLKRPGLPENLQDHLLTICAEMLQQGFDSPDLRIRLESRKTALATQLLPDLLIPTEASLRATMKSSTRDIKQPEIASAYSAPKIQCICEVGSFVIRLDGKKAPNTSAMIVDLIERGYYDNLTFHRVVPDFVVQGGDPRGDGWGGPGYTIRSEWNNSEYKRGAVGIAHDGKDTGGSQFFVTLSEQPHLNGRYTIFGEVIEGMDVVDILQQGDHFQLKITP